MIKSLHYRSSDTLSEIRLPIRLHERPTRRRTLGFVGRGLVFAAFVVGPPALLASLIFLAGERPDLGAAIEGHIVLGLAAAVIIGASLLLGSVFGIWGRIGKRRVITINDREVWVQEKRLFGRAEWREPLSSFCGVERQVNATLGGWRKKLLLQHPDPRRTVPVWIGETEPEGLVQGYEKLLTKAV